MKRWYDFLFNILKSGTYIPKKEVEVVETIRATIIQPNQAIRLRARKETRVTIYTCRNTSQKMLLIVFPSTYNYFRRSCMGSMFPDCLRDNELLAVPYTAAYFIFLASYLLYSLTKNAELANQ